MGAPVAASRDSNLSFIILDLISGQLFLALPKPENKLVSASREIIVLLLFNMVADMFSDHGSFWIDIFHAPTRLLVSFRHSDLSRIDLCKSLGQQQRDLPGKL